tara:strand:+ start:36335 stop:37777 length:1443 start_codon:yes stop_codon:yes gene_type:complete
LVLVSPATARQQIGKVVLGTPVNGLIMNHGVGVTWDFDWPDIPNATRYQILIENANKEDRLVNTYVSTSNFSYTFTKDLTARAMERPWGWWVRAGNSTTWGEWSSPHTIYLEEKIPAPTIYHPQTSALLSSVSPNNSTNYTWTFDWSDIPGAQTYEIRLNNPSQQNVFDYHVRESKYVYNQTVPILSSNLNGWSWQVRAAVDGKIGLWSELFYFNVEPARTVVTVPNPNFPTQNAVLPNGLNTGLKWSFNWFPVSGATQYELVIGYTNGGEFFRTTVNRSNYDYINATTSIKNEFLTGWLWKIRAQVNGVWSDWSQDMLFSVEHTGEGLEPINKYGNDYYKIMGGFINAYLACKTEVYGGRDVTFGPTNIVIEHEGDDKCEFQFVGTSKTEELYLIKVFRRNYANEREEIGYLSYNLEVRNSQNYLWKIDNPPVGYFRIYEPNSNMAIEILDGTSYDPELKVDLKPMSRHQRQSMRFVKN